MTRADYYAQLAAFKREQARHARADRARARRDVAGQPEAADAPRTTARERAIDRAAAAAQAREEQS